MTSNDGSKVTERKITVRALAGVVAACTVAAGAWQLFTPAAPASGTPPLTNEVVDVSQPSTPPYADDDDSDEAAVWRLKRDHEQWLADQSTGDPDDPISSYSTTDDMAMPTSSSSTIYLDATDLPEQDSE
ncbi:hypothetical protein [Kineococcus sp. SYSU DK003]|uniref:hypothetical protein n=1 Tax=Kineococcus sp. SYSU DK003 TaxID=3383124 RepID=UPI003D7DF789